MMVHTDYSVGEKMKIDEITNYNKIEVLAESIDNELRAIVKRHVANPLSNLTGIAAIRLKAWALEVYHTLDKGIDSNKISFRTLKAIINDPERFTQQLITYELNKRAKATNENQ